MTRPLPPEEKARRAAERGEPRFLTEAARAQGYETRAQRQIERDRAIVAAIDAGRFVTDIELEFQCDRRFVRAVAKRNARVIKRGESPWTEERDATLRALWESGMPSAEVALRIDMSKNAVIGRVRRLGLDGRPSPIKRGRAPEPRVVGDRPGPKPRLKATLPPLASAAEARPLAQPVRAAPEPPPPKPAPVTFAPAPEPPPPKPAPVTFAPAPKPPPPKPAPVTFAPAPEPPPVRITRARTCCWPIGEVGTKSFRFCDAPAVAPKSYCEVHASRAYVRVRSGEAA